MAIFIIFKIFFDYKRPLVNAVAHVDTVSRKKLRQIKIVNDIDIEVSTESLIQVAAVAVHG